MRAVQTMERSQLKSGLPPMRVGDAVIVHFRVREGDKERIQQFQGVAIRHRGSGMGETFTVRKVSFGVGVERTFPIHSPLIEKIEITGRSKVRRSRLYYLRDLRGRKARLKEAALQIAVPPEPEPPAEIAPGEPQAEPPPQAS